MSFQNVSIGFQMNKKGIVNNISLKEVDFNNPESVNKLTNEVLSKMKKEGKTIQEVVGVNDTFLEGLYSLAYSQYNAGRYKEALELFDFLVKLAPKTFKYSLGMASCLYQLKSYDLASVFYYTSLCVKEDPYAAFYLADCFLKQGHIKEGLEGLDFSIELSGNKKEYAPLKQRCNLIKNGILKK